MATTLSKSSVEVVQDAPILQVMLALEVEVAELMPNQSTSI
jgi:hypothetical protein